MLTVGSIAPQFSLPDHTGTQRALSDWKGKWVLVYFYPQDDTPGCTIEACQLRDNLPKFDQSNIAVIGISTDSVASHAQFVAKYGLPFTLLADEQKKVVKAYGAARKHAILWFKFMGTKRISYLVDPNGVVRKVYPAVQPAEHATEVLADVAALAKSA